MATDRQTHTTYSAAAVNSNDSCSYTVQSMTDISARKLLQLMHESQPLSYFCYRTNSHYTTCKHSTHTAQYIMVIVIHSDSRQTIYGHTAWLSIGLMALPAFSSLYSLILTSKADVSVYTASLLCGCLIHSLLTWLMMTEMGRYRLCRYRYNIGISFWPEISSISFIAVLFGLLTYFVIARKVISDIKVIP